MSIRDRIAAWLAGDDLKMQAIDNLPGFLSATAEGHRYSIPDRSMPEAQSELYQRLSWVQMAVQAVAQAASVEKVNVKRQRGEKSEHVENHPFEELLRRPNPLESRFELLYATFAFLQLTGTGYWWLNRTNENEPPDEIWTVPSHQIAPIPDGRMFVSGYKYDPGGGQKEVELPPWQIVQFRRWHPLSWFTGLSPIEALARVAEGDMAAQKWNTEFFAKNYAKSPGALAFADPIPDPVWESMKADIIRQHGGTNRNLMMLRNTGSGGVSWVNMAMSQADMEFLEGRQFTKEEIFGLYAPGLASVLAVNATEANSMAGKATFQEFAVWPQMVAVQEKITNDVMPAYGENFVAEFDDVRQTDTALELSEQETFAKFHTIDEVRERWYEAPPLGDERGAKLVAEIGVSTEAIIEADAAAEAPDAPGAPDVQPPEPPQAETPDEEEPDEDAEKRRETKALKRYLRNRDAPDVAKFDNVWLTDDEVAEIAAGCGVAVEQPFCLEWTAYP